MEIPSLALLRVSFPSPHYYVGSSSCWGDYDDDDDIVLDSQFPARRRENLLILNRDLVLNSLE